MDYKLIWQTKKGSVGLHFSVWETKGKIFFSQERNITSLPKEQAVKLTKALVEHLELEEK